ncbi:MAG: hypothetical protein ACK51W_02645, partial [Aphanizomenon sp.]
DLFSVENKGVNFFGRDDDLKKLNTLFNQHQKMIVIQAPGGIGKTTLAVIIATAFPLKASAQNADIDFIGTIPSVVKINSTSPGSIQNTPNQDNSTPVVLNITNTTGIVLSITNIANQGTVLSGSKTYNDLDLINAKVKDGDNLVIESEISPSGKSTPVHPLNVASAVQAAVSSGKDYLIYLKITNISGLLPQRTYKIYVNILITPQ